MTCLRPPLRTAATLALAATLVAPAAVHAQDASARRLTLEESQSYQMSLELAFACSPYRHRRALESSSTIRRQGDALPGTAVHFRSIEGTYLVLEQYDQELDGHCLVFGSFGGSIEPGRHAVRPLSMTNVETESERGEHSFYGMSAVRTSQENAILVVESGDLVIDAVEDGRITGSFELTGFLVEGGTADRAADVTWAGSFVAVRGAD